ncbi:helix-hairpin-helix domain-containing protein [Actinophytocola glycyrrhizae]|uniref:Helix-hairpin-helix domain-containing protein n=1 Tax=Actinophytocola glycyrrhizae TaxID=2044873 RepID=A0ABV9SG31_9PSEU
MIETTARRERRIDSTRDRLAGLMGQALAEPRVETAELPPDQEWDDVSVDPPDPPSREPWWRGPAGRLMAQWAPETAGAGRRKLAVAVVGGLVLAAMVAVGVAVSSGGTEHEAPPVLPVAAASESRGPAETPIVVSVVGRVARPGLITLPEGARVADALRETGGPVPGADLGALNLARKLGDGEQIYVGVPPPPGAEPVTGATASGEPEKVDLNTATLTDLDALPGVGPVTAQSIVDWRTEHGRFDSVDQLREIHGIGPSRFAKLQDLVVAR